MDLGISFKNIREGKGKSVYALSKETGVSENHIHSIEKGTTQPSVAILERLLNALGVTLPESLMMTVMFFILRHMNGN